MMVCRILAFFLCVCIADTAKAGDELHLLLFKQEYQRKLPLEGYFRVVAVLPSFQLAASRVESLLKDVLNQHATAAAIDSIIQKSDQCLQPATQSREKKNTPANEEWFSKIGTARYHCEPNEVWNSAFEQKIQTWSVPMQHPPLKSNVRNLFRREEVYRRDYKHRLKKLHEELQEAHRHLDLKHDLLQIREHLERLVGATALAELINSIVGHENAYQKIQERDSKYGRSARSVLRRLHGVVERELVDIDWDKISAAQESGGPTLKPWSLRKKITAAHLWLLARPKVEHVPDAVLPVCVGSDTSELRHQKIFISIAQQTKIPQNLWNGLYTIAISLPFMHRKIVQLPGVVRQIGQKQDSSLLENQLLEAKAWIKLRRADSHSDSPSPTQPQFFAGLLGFPFKGLGSSASQIVNDIINEESPDSSYLQIGIQKGSHKLHRRAYTLAVLELSDYFRLPARHSALKSVGDIRIEELKRNLEIVSKWMGSETARDFLEALVPNLDLNGIIFSAKIKVHNLVELVRKKRTIKARLRLATLLQMMVDLLIGSWGVAEFKMDALVTVPRNDLLSIYSREFT
eukprot:Gregarina_sp_Poly_1__1191@NODE_1291_length_4476_cov_38_535722_g872_i0_p1_GENE_NODE_1291_length_4476_cov_38_535722_g872_i0NODE_1291_length_4476_cov_38_535722_g872_i0_p1_ORF_typecomplete_len573_score78_89TPD52/PF04201_15/0_06HMMR_C/PF15908_5/0_055MyTH4/PF00784_17/0_13CRA/PF06589_11/1_4e02CRA/PF06589_11/6_9_NODE_1291_length_4476_cov_38_535722_g872_i020403758